MAATSKLKIIIDSVANTLGFDTAKRSVDGLQDSSHTAGKSLKSLSTTALTVAGSVAAIGFAAKQAFEFGKQGAAVTQTAESFDLLLDKVGAAPDLLEQLQTASRGTIDDMQLMSSTSLLLAGTSGELAEAYADNSTKLLEIAKAAQKLNPTLGDTAYFNQSINTAVKRNSKLWLDNLGIVVDVEAANRAYAATLGKTSSQLTDTEKSMAFLNDAIQKGEILIDQVGGTTESATDDFERLETTLTNLWNTIKTKTAPSIANAAGGLDNWLNNVDESEIKFNKQIDNLQTSSNSWGEYAQGVMLASREAGIYNVKHQSLIATIFNVDDSLRLMAQTLSALSQGYQQTTGFQIENAEAMNEWTTGLGNTTEKVYELSAGLGEDGVWSTANLAALGLDAMGESAEKTAEEVEKLTDQTDDLMDELKKLRGLGISTETSLSTMGWTYNHATGWAPPAGTYGTTPAPTPGGSAPSVTVNMNGPALGFVNEYELEQKLAPIIRRVIHR